MREGKMEREAKYEMLYRQNIWKSLGEKGQREGMWKRRGGEKRGK